MRLIQSITFDLLRNREKSVALTFTQPPTLIPRSPYDLES
jgi:hypothetical protein